MKESVNHPKLAVVEGASAVKALLKMTAHLSLIPCPAVSLVVAFGLGVASLYNGWIVF